MVVSFLDRLKSRKFLLAAGGILGYLLLGLTEQMKWPTVMEGIKALIISYLAVEGGADALERMRPESTKPKDVPTTTPTPSPFPYQP